MICFLAATSRAIEGVEELFLRAVLVVKELDVVDQQQVGRVVLGLQRVEGLSLVVGHDIGDELLGVQVTDDRASGRSLQHRVAHRRWIQVGLARGRRRR